MATTDKRTEEKSFLKYGEQIILASFQQNLYLANRGLSFQAGIIAKCKREETINKFYLYPNLHEIIFEIHPNLNYESLMEFTECSNNDPNKDILEKRMILEANLNHAKIEENRGKFVKLGSVVQLYHPNSKTYLSFSTQKVGKSEMSAIGCTSETNESVQFTITSPFDFLKEGSLISYDDKFLFTDAYNKTLAYPISKEELEMTTLKLETKLERGLLNFFGGGSKEKEFKIPSIIENQKLFQGHFAGAVNEKSIGIQYSNQFEAINIENSYEKNELKENDLRWGDLVNIRKVDNSGKYSLMVAEVNKSSFGHNVIYRTFNQDSSSKMVNLESQFEIIHLNMRARGSTITFDKFNTVKVLLKHVLSGKFLAVDPETKKLILGKDYEDEYENLKNEKYKLESEYQSQYNAYMKIKESKRYDDITKKDAPHMTQADIDFFQSHGKEFIQSNKDYFKAYIMQRAFILEKVSSDESLHLNNSTFIKIRTFNNKSISIVSDLEHLNFVNENTRRKENNENFENNFFEELGDSIQQETLQVSDNCDIFHFEKNDKNMVRRFNRLNSYTAFLASVICMSDMKQSTTLQYLSVVDKIESILQSLITKKKLLKHTAQFLMVQMSTVDLLMDYLIKVRSFSKDSDDHMRLITDACASTISLLNLICENNPLVCTYLFQWRKFFTVSIVKVDNQVFKQINIDSLLFKIVDILKCYSIYIDDYLSNLCSSIKFENLDIRKLTVLLQITKNFLNLHDPVSVDKVFEKIFNPAHKSDIFKKLEYDEHDAHKIRFLGKEGHINVDEHFKDNEMIYRYFLQILNLVINLGELDAAKTAKNLHQNFPKEVCIYIFSDQENRYPGELRAAFLKLFALLYIVNLFQNNSLITYEEHITAAKIRGDLRKSSETLKTLQTLKESDENKKFMSSLLNNLTSSNNELALASLQTFNLLLGFKFFDEEYITNIKKNLDGLIVGENKRLKAEEPYRRDHRKDQKKGSAPPHKMESFVFEDRFVTRPDGPAFSIDDPTTLIEVVEMLTKLHRSAVRNKVLQVISEDKKLMQSEVSPKGAPNPEKNLTKEEIAFNRAYSSELAAINEGNEDVWRVITQWIKLKDSKLTSSILKYIFESSLMKHFFIEKYTEFFQVEADEDSSIYTRVRAYLRNFSDQLRDLMSEYSTSDSKTIRARSSSLFREYQALFDYFFIVMHPNDRQTKFELSIKDHNRQSPNDLLDLSSQDVFMNLLNMFLMDCKYLKSKQTIIYKSGLLEIVMKTAICFNTKIFVSFPRLEIEPVEKSRFSILPEFETKDYFKDEINCIILLILYFSLVTNPQNISFLMKNYRQDFQEFLLSSLRAQNQVVKRIAICLLIEVYKNNIEDLLNLRNDDKLFFQALLKQVQTEIDTKNYSILVNYIEFFAVATQFNSAILEENAKDIFNCLFDENLQDSNTVSHLISKDIPDEIKAYTTIQNQATKLDISKTKSGIIFNEEQQDLDEMDERSNIFSVLELSDRMLFISDLLGLLAGFGKNCSADFKNKIQKKLSMNTLIEIASSCKFNYYLKTTLIEVLSNIYITTKVDQNSKSFVLELISSIFSSDLKEYFKSQSNSLTSKDVFFINSTPYADCMLLQTTNRGLAPNFMIDRLESLFLKFAGQYVLPFTDRFLAVCAIDQNVQLIEAVMASFNDVIKAVEKATKTVVISLPPGAMQFNSQGSDEGLGKSRLEASTVHQQYVEESVGYLTEDFRMKYLYLAKVYMDAYQGGELNKRIAQSRDFLLDYHRNSSEKPEKEHSIYFDRLTQLMFLREMPVEEIEVDYVGWRKAAMEQAKVDNDLLLVQKQSQSNNGNLIKAKLRKKDGLEKRKSILFKSNTSVPSVNQSNLTSPPKLSPKKAPKKGQNLAAIRLINVNEVQIGKKVYPIDHHKVKPYHHSKRFRSFVHQLLDLLQQAGDPQVNPLIIKYLHYCLKSSALKPLVLDIVKNEGGMPSILKLMINAEPSVDTMALLNDLLEIDLRLQADLIEEFFQDFENKMINRLMMMIEDTCNSFVELENILSQFKNLQDNGMIEEGEIYEIETLKMSKERIRLFTELIRFPALLCRGHNLSMQNFLRYQKVGGFVRPFQVNIIGKLRDILKKAIKFLSERNLQSIRSILDLLTKLVQGPCKENQKEMILKKVTGVLEEMFTKVSQLTDPKLELEKSKINLNYMMLKLGIVECSSDTLVLKTLSLSFNPEILIGRLEQIYMYLYDVIEYRLSSYRTQRQPARGQPIGNLEEQALTFTAKAAVNRIMENGDYSFPMKEGLHIVMWMNTLSDFDPEVTKRIHNAIEDLSEESRYISRAMKFFKDLVRSIEIVDNEKNIQTVYFYLHPITKYLSRYSKAKFEYDIDRRTWSTKLSALLTAIDPLYIEMMHFANLSRFNITANLSYLYYLKVANLFLALLLNLVLLLDDTVSNFKAGGGRVFPPWSEASAADRFVQFLGAIILIFYFFVLILWIAFEFFVKLEIFQKAALSNLDEMIKKHELTSSNKISRIRYIFFRLVYFMDLIWCFLSRTNMLIILAYIVVSFLGLLVSKFYFSLLLLDIVDISPLIWNIIHSLTLNISTLGATAVFGFILLFIYSSFAFFSQLLEVDLGVIDQDMTVFCDNLAMCFLNMASFGLKTGGGIGEKLILPPNYYDKGRFVFRTIFDIIFWLTIIILLLNIILSIIIDSFAELRNQRMTIQEDIANVCFICGLSKEHFHRAEESFNLHTKRTHYMWNYVFFVVGLKAKPNELQTGIESLVELKLLEKDLTWFPLRRTKKLAAEDKEDEVGDSLLDLEMMVEKLSEKNSR
jgi:hypothetical protein